MHFQFHHLAEEEQGVYELRRLPDFDFHREVGNVMGSSLQDAFAQIETVFRSLITQQPEVGKVVVTTPNIHGMIIAAEQSRLETIDISGNSKRTLKFLIVP